MIEVIVTERRLEVKWIGVYGPIGWLFWIFSCYLC